MDIIAYIRTRKTLNKFRFFYHVYFLLDNCFFIIIVNYKSQFCKEYYLEIKCTGYIVFFCKIVQNNTVALCLIKEKWFNTIYVV